MKKMQLHVSPFYLFVHESDMWQRLVHSTRAFRHSHLLLVHCFVIVRHAHCCVPLPTEQGLLAERLPQSYNAACAYRPNLPGIRFFWQR